MLLTMEAKPSDQEAWLSILPLEPKRGVVNIKDSNPIDRSGINHTFDGEDIVRRRGLGAQDQHVGLGMAVSAEARVAVVAPHGRRALGTANACSWKRSEASC